MAKICRVNIFEILYFRELFTSVFHIFIYEYPYLLLCSSSASESVGCLFKFLFKIGVEESIMNAPLVSLQGKNTNNAKSEVRFKQLIRDL
jgi:hypothetical protein